MRGGILPALFGVLTLAILLWGFAKVMTDNDRDRSLPSCECAGHAYHSVGCAPPPGLPEKCYEHSDIHDGRFW